MKNKVINIEDENGFTLIELLAVIVILGILMIVAIPQVTKYIENSKKSTYADTAKSYIDSARYMLLNDDFTTGYNDSTCTLPEESKTIYIKLNDIKLEKGGTNSSYGKAFDLDNSFVMVKNNGGKFEYSIFIKDAGKNGTVEITAETDVDKTKIKKGGVKENKLPSGEVYCTASAPGN